MKEAVSSLVAVTVALAAYAGLADAVPARIFSDHMVLQRDRPIRIWGWARKGERVRVGFGGQEAVAVTGTNGLWVAELPATGARKEGGDLVIRGNGNEVRFRDVVVGDVWLCAGQSNMEMSFCWGILNGAEEIAKSPDYPLVRSTKFRKLQAFEPSADSCNLPWAVCDTNSLWHTTACGYFFARAIQRETGVPVGILDDNWSGSNIEPFMPDAAFPPSFAKERAQLKERREYLSVARNRKSLQKTLTSLRLLGEFAAECKAEGRSFDYFPTSLPDRTKVPFNCNCGTRWNAMMAPLVRFPIAGAIWYQGCSNAGQSPHAGPTKYEVRLEGMVREWRRAWGEDFPFYFVQLAAHKKYNPDPEGGDYKASIRVDMLKAHRMIPRSGMAVTFDIGNADDIHPKNKLDVGERLALWALRDVYGRKDVVPSGPLCRAARRDGGAIRVSFDYAEPGLMAAAKDPNAPGVTPVPEPDAALEGFAVGGADGKWFWAKAEIDGGEVVVSAPEVSEPTAVSYAYRSNPMGHANLYNRAGLPASPFLVKDVK